MKTKILPLAFLVSLTCYGQFELDTNFNNTGVLLSSIGTNGVASGAQSNGKFLVVDNYLARFHDNGSLDSTFGINGVIDSIPIHVADMVIQADDKIVLGGYIVDSISGKDFALCRYNKHGTLDLTYGQNGIVIDVLSIYCSSPAPPDNITALALQPDGMVVAAGEESQTGTFGYVGGAPTVRRYDTQGISDTNFKVPIDTANFGPIPALMLASLSEIRSIALQMDGKIVLGGKGANCSVCPFGNSVLRLTADGIVDTSFGPHGWFFYSENNYSSGITALAIAPNGDIVASETTLDFVNITTDTKHLKITPSGNLDLTFGNSGFSLLPNSINPFPIFLSNNDLIIATTIISGSVTNVSYDFGLVNLTANGMLDTNCSKGISQAGLVFSSLAESAFMNNDGSVFMCGTDNNLVITKFKSSIPSGSISDSSCAKYVFNGKEYHSSGVYQDTLQNGQGCDSIVYLNITIGPGDMTVSQNGSTLTVMAINSTYQWLDCNTMLPIAGETLQTYTATANGSYAVIVTENGCTDTSACITINHIGIEEIEENTLSVFPNPSSGSFTIQFLDHSYSGDLEIYTLSGQRVYAQNIQHQEQLELNLPLAKGIYQLKLSSKKQHLIQPLIIQ